MDIEKFIQLCETRTLRLIDELQATEEMACLEKHTEPLITRMSNIGDDFLYYHPIAKSAVENVINNPELFRKSKRTPSKKLKDENKYSEVA
jgi:hypothetical protein